jgi:hypothetical protein
MKIDNIGPRSIIGHLSSPHGRHAVSPSHARNVSDAGFPEAAKPVSSKVETADLRRLAPLTNDEQHYLVRLFAATNAVSAGYDAQRKYATGNFSGSNLDIEA